ncbi:MAG: T9SS type A sorting domain-containing protein [Bacteroidetes bacterium]|nr:T9SS type A sorting domain-containing protein [Bacteroidota bacterium]
MKPITTLFLLLISFNLSAQNALNFDGTNDFVMTNFPGPTGNSTRTVEAMIKFTTLSSSQKVILDWGDMAVGNRFTLNIINGIPRIEVGGFGVSAPSALSAGGWHHIAGVYESTGNILKLYVNGSLANSGIPTVTVATSALNNIMIGRRNDSINYFQGSIDEVRIWSDERTSTEIANYKNVELCLPAPNLEAYYRFNEGAAGGNNAGITSLPDLSTLSNNGTLNGFALTGITSNWVTGINSLFTQSATICKGTPFIFGTQTITTGGVYLETFITTLGCDSTVQLTLTLDSVNTTVFQSSNSLISQQLSATYQWVDCNNNYAALPGQTSGSFTAMANGSYAAIITKGNCTDTTACFSITTIGIHENNLDAQFTLAPNPSTTSCLITAPTGKNALYTLYDLQGRIVQSKTFNTSENINTSALNPGLYFVEVINNGSVAIQKLMIQ